jgi:hypothetical protein
VQVRAKGAFHPGAGLHLCAGHAGVQCGEHPHRTLKDSKKKNTTSPGLRIRNGRAPLKKGHRSGCDQCYKFYISFFILGTAPPQLLVAAGLFLSAQKFRQLGDVRRNAPRAHSLALGELSHLSTVDSE